MLPGTERDGALRTRVYIDGYNLYYGCLKNTHHKWLDVHALVERILPTILHEQDGQPRRYALQRPAIKYFTAPILKAFARSHDSVSCQSHYHQALLAHCRGQVSIITGYHDAKPARAHQWIEGRAARECEMVEIWKLEEKQSDVALALHAFSDALRGEVDQIIAITNDSDFAPAMEMIREQTDAIIGLIAPTKKNGARVNAELEKYAHWTRSHISEDELAQSQLPGMVRNDQRALHKPLSWYPRPDLLTPIFEEAKRVKGSAGAARKWLNQPCSHLGNRIPISMCDTPEAVAELHAYMDQYAREVGPPV